MAKHMCEATQEQRDVIEGLIDSIGMTGVLEAIYDVCIEKAGHITESYDDKSLASLWVQAGSRVRRASDAIEV